MRSAAAAGLIASTLLASNALAQVKWDAGAQAGVTTRLAGRAKVGPEAMLDAHVALVPMLRVGAWIEGDAAARDLVAAGARAKWTPPIGSASWRAWVFAGAGYGVGVQGGASIFEAPLGVGAAYKLRTPWLLTSELGARLGSGDALAVSWSVGLSFER